LPSSPGNPSSPSAPFSKKKKTIQEPITTEKNYQQIPPLKNNNNSIKY